MTVRDALTSGERMRPLEANLAEAVQDMWARRRGCVRVKLTPWGLNPPNQDRELARGVLPNVLVVGAEAAIVEVLHGLRSNCRQPVATREAGASLVLPPRSETGALILRAVGNLTLEGQRCLMEWLDDDARDRVQVIATNASSLWPRVKDGSFTEALYYRLNTIYIDLTDDAHRGDQTSSRPA